MLRCPLCNAPHATCGPASAATPVDLFTAPREERVLSDLREYTMDVNGYVTTVQLTDKDAERLGLTAADATKPETVKATQLHDRQAVPDDEADAVAPTTKARSVPNKAR